MKLLKQGFRKPKLVVPPTVVCEQLLDDIMLRNGVFNYEETMALLNEMKCGGAISLLEFIHLVDACNHLKNDRHYRNSLIYSKAKAQEK